MNNFMLPKEPLSEQFLNHFLTFFSTIKNVFWNAKVTWMLKVVHGTINGNKVPLFLG